MCSLFTQDFDIRQFSLQHDIHYPETIKRRVLPYQSASVIIKQDDDLIIKDMGFSLVPHWSKEPKVKFATHNARIETIEEKPTWREPLQKHHCIIPISSFMEPVYEGEFVGNIIEFHPKKDSVLWAAGIFDIWNQQKETFTIMTTKPDHFIEKNGHDRSPVFMNYDNAIQWLSTFTNMLKYIKSNIYRPELTISIDRALKPGWEKRK